MLCNGLLIVLYDAKNNKKTPGIPPARCARHAMLHADADCDGRVPSVGRQAVPVSIIKKVFLS
jgi:hypothetical protein